MIDAHLSGEREKENEREKMPFLHLLSTSVLDAGIIIFAVYSCGTLLFAAGITLCLWCIFSDHLCMDQKILVLKVIFWQNYASI